MPYRGLLYQAAVFAAWDRLLEYLAEEFAVLYQWVSRAAAFLVLGYRVPLLLAALFAEGFWVLLYHLQLFVVSAEALAC